MLPVATAIQRQSKFSRQKLTHAYYAFACYVRREGHLYDAFLVLVKTRLILYEMCRLYGKFASYLRRVLCKTRLIFSRITGPIVQQRALDSETRTTTCTRFSQYCSRVSQRHFGGENVIAVVILLRFLTRMS